MKYNENNKPIVCMQTNSTCYKNTTTMEVKGVLWHSTGANNPNIKRYVQPSDNASDKEEMLKLLGVNSYKNDWNHISRQAGLNCWIGKLADGTVATVQTMPWNYKPWGCGSGSKGSLNNTHIQFEICEDGLSDKNYFDKVYKEACEITAYLCKMYNLNPHGTVVVNGVSVPTILCHKDSSNLNLGSNHADIYHWFGKYGKTMDDVRNDVAELMGASSNSIPSPSVQSKPEASTTVSKFKVGDEVKLITGAKYTSGKSIASWVFNKILYVRAVNGNNITISTLKSGAITGTVDIKYLVCVTSNLDKQEDIKQDNVSQTVNELKIGDEVKLVSGAKYTSGKSIASWVFGTKLYVRAINGNKITISTLKSGAITGIVDIEYLVYYSGKSITSTNPTIDNTSFKVGDAVKLVSGAKYTSGASIPSWVFQKTLYVRTLKGDSAVISTLKSGAVTGTVALKYLTKI